MTCAPEFQLGSLLVVSRTECVKSPPTQQGDRVWFYLPLEYSVSFLLVKDRRDYSECFSSSELPESLTLTHALHQVSSYFMIVLLKQAYIAAFQRFRICLVK